MLLLGVISIDCHYYYRRYWKKQKHLLLYHNTNKKFIYLFINNIIKKCIINSKIQIKNCTYYFFDYIKNLDPNKIKTKHHTKKNLIILDK